MACIPCRATCTSVRAQMYDRMRAITHNKLEVLGKRKPQHSKHAVKGIVGIVDSARGVK